MNTIIKQTYGLWVFYFLKWSLVSIYLYYLGVVPFFSIEMDDLIKKLQSYQKDQTLMFKYPISEASTDAIRYLLAYNPVHRCEIK